MQLTWLGHSCFRLEKDGFVAVIDPGIVELNRWRPGPRDPDFPAGMPLLGAVARKP